MVFQQLKCMDILKRDELRECRRKLHDKIKHDIDWWHIGYLMIYINLEWLYKVYWYARLIVFSEHEELGTKHSRLTSRYSVCICLGELRNRQIASWKLVFLLAEVCVDTSQMQVTSDTTWSNFFDTWSDKTIKVKVKFPPVLSTIPWKNRWPGGNLHLL
jgi:hypothetical protein